MSLCDFAKRCLFSAPRTGFQLARYPSPRVTGCVSDLWIDTSGYRRKEIADHFMQLLDAG